MNPFAIGNIAVYHGKGVGLITGLVTSDPRGNPCVICVLDLKKSTAQVRVDHPSQTSIRTVMNTEELDEVYEILRTQNVKPNTTTWNRRYRGYIQNINSGIPKEIATVLRDLELLSIKKSLSFGESKIYADAKELIVEEGAYTRIIPQLNTFLLPLENAKAQHLLGHLQTILNKSLPKEAPTVDSKGLKELQNLTLEIDPNWQESEFRLQSLYSNTLSALNQIEDEANKIIMRSVRRLVNCHHEPNKETADSPEQCFAILRPWRDYPLVGLVEPKRLATHKGYESLKNLFMDKGCDGVEGLDILPVLEPLVHFTTHHLLIQLRDFLSENNIKPERRRRKKTKERKNADDFQSPLKLDDAILETNLLLRNYSLSCSQQSNIQNAQQELHNLYFEMDSQARKLSLETIRLYIDEHLEEHRESVSEDLEEIFKDAKEQGRKEREEKLAKKKKGKNKKAEPKPPEEKKAEE